MNAAQTRHRILNNLETIFGAAQFLLFDPDIDVVTFDMVQGELSEKPIKPISDEDYTGLFLTRETYRFSVRTPDGVVFEFDEKDSEIRANLRRLTVLAFGAFLDDELETVSVGHLLSEAESIRSIDGEDYLAIGSIAKNDDLISVKRKGGRVVSFSIHSWLTEEDGDWGTPDGENLLN